MHNHDVSDATAVSATAELIRLSGVAVGDDSTARTGRSILAKTLQIRARFLINASATTSQLRLIIGIDNQPNTTIATAAEILDDTGNAITSMRERDTDRGRFKILVDKVMSVNINGNRTALFNRFIHLGNHHITFDGTAADNDAKGKLFWFCVSNESTNTVTKVMSTRLKFYDN